MYISDVKISSGLREYATLYDKESGKFLNGYLEAAILDECYETAGLDHIKDLQGVVYSVNDVSFKGSYTGQHFSYYSGIAVVLEVEPWEDYCRMIINVGKETYVVAEVENCTDEILEKLEKEEWGGE